MGSVRFGVFAGAVASAVLGAQALAQPPQFLGEEHGLGLTGKSMPAALRQAAADPYAMPPPPVCLNADRELTDLTKILGPDVDAPPGKGENKVVELASGAVRHAIPYRGWIRFITGADRKDKTYDKAARAGWERRGYLKGLERQYDCLHQGEALVARADAGAATDVVETADAAPRLTPPPLQPTPVAEKAPDPTPAPYTPDPPAYDPPPGPAAAPQHAAPAVPPQVATPAQIPAPDADPDA